MARALRKSILVVQLLLTPLMARDHPEGVLLYEKVLKCIAGDHSEAPHRHQRVFRSRSD
ncbi:MAG: hypothetical protein QW517_08400 [Thermofilaceae archaeon]